MPDIPFAVPNLSRPWRLRTRLAIGLFVLFVAVFGLFAYSHLQFLEVRRDARVDDTGRISQTLAAAFDGLVHDLESFALSTAITLGDARVPISQDVPPEAAAAVEAYLQHLFDSHGLLRAIIVTDPQGRVVYDQDGASFGVDLSERSYIQALQQGATDFWSQGFPGAQTGRMIVAYARAIVTPEGETTGFLVIPFYTETLATRIPAGVSDGGHVSIIDGDGTLIMRLPDDGNAAVGTVLSDWEALSAVQGQRAVTINNDSTPLGPDDRYGTLTPMSSLDWTVGYTMSADAVEGDATGLFLRDVALFGAIVLLGFAAMWMFANRTVQPLTRLTQAAGAISRGETAPVEELRGEGNAEVALLAGAMADMQSSIRDRENRLQSQANTIEAIERFGESLARELDVDRAVDSIISAGTELTGADSVEFFYEPSVYVQKPSAFLGADRTLALAADGSVVQDVLKGAVVQVPDASGASGEAATGGARSILGVPVANREGAVQGALILLKSEAGGFSAAQRRLAEGLARWASIVLENAALYAQSQTLVEELAKSNEAKNDFLGIVSHELRTPITTIYGGTLLLRLRRESLPEQAFNDMIVSISEEAERLHHLVQDLLTIARTELVVEPKPIAIAEVLQTTIGDFSTTHRREIEVTIEPELPEAMGDNTYLRQVTTNLISNADKYTPPDKPLEITAVLEGDEVVVRVQDNGDGIKEEDLPRVFDSFYRAKDAAERASGSGLGLTVCKRLIESLGGRIWAKNRPEGGLEVGFTLKAAGTEQDGDDAGNLGNAGAESMRMNGTVMRRTDTNGSAGNHVGQTAPGEGVTT